MRVKYICKRCDFCHKEKKERGDENYGGITTFKGWFELREIKGCHGADEYDFCSLSCLIKYVGKRCRDNEGGFKNGK